MKKSEIPHIAIISSSVRTERNSHRVALFFENYLKGGKLCTTEILDLKELNFPIFNSPFKFQKEPTKETVDFAKKIETCDGIIIVTPEYNGGYPASLKNVIDLLYDEWYHKPVSISTVSTGLFGGSQAITSLQFILWKMHALTTTEMFPVPKVTEAFNELGKPTDEVLIHKLAEVFIKELIWCIHVSKQISNH